MSTKPSLPHKIANPAAGWFGKQAWRPPTGSGQEGGLYAIDVEWTERATQMIKGGEYKYIFPVFAYDKKTGKVLWLLYAALTNNPTFDGILDRLSMGELRGELRLLGGCP